MSATILIVEDEFAVARGIQYALQQEGYQVAVAKSGDEGLDFATNQAPDLVVLDVRLPGMDGFEVLRRLASRPGRVYTRGELLELLRDYEALDQDEKTINVHVSHLRDKIEDDPAAPAFVMTVRGVGYAFAER